MGFFQPLNDLNTLGAFFFTGSTLYTIVCAVFFTHPFIGLLAKLQILKHDRIIENTDARVVIHWRYASVDVLYKHPNSCRNEDGWGVWTDEYLTVYPDGVGVRTVNVHGD